MSAKEKHTPGPWWTTDSGVRDRGGYICHTNPVTRYPDQDERFAKEVAERAANKRLIAASPELLEALQGVLPFALQFINDNHEAMKAARAAIAKATGARP